MKCYFGEIVEISSLFLCSSFAFLLFRFVLPFCWEREREKKGRDGYLSFLVLLSAVVLNGGKKLLLNDLIMNGSFSFLFVCSLLPLSVLVVAVVVVSAKKNVGTYLPSSFTISFFFSYFYFSSRCTFLLLIRTERGTITWRNPRERELGTSAASFVMSESHRGGNMRQREYMGFPSRGTHRDIMRQRKKRERRIICRPACRCEYLSFHTQTNSLSLSFSYIHGHIQK